MILGNRVGPVAMALAAMLVAGLATACSSSPQPQTTGSAYFAAWAKQDWAAMQQLVSQPPADFTMVNKAAFTNLSVHQATFTPGTTVTSGASATEPFTERLALTGVGTITIKSTLHLAKVQGHWLVKWSPATIAPSLKAGDQLSVHETWPARAAILGAGGAPVFLRHCTLPLLDILFAVLFRARVPHVLRRGTPQAESGTRPRSARPR